MEFPETIDNNLEAVAIDGLLTKYRNEYDVNHNGLSISLNDIYDNSDFDFALRISKLNPDFHDIKQLLLSGILFERNYNDNVLDEIGAEILFIKRVVDIYKLSFASRDAFIIGKPQYIANNKLLLIHKKILEDYSKLPEKK